MPDNLQIDLNSNFLFVQVVEHGSYTRAAEALSMAKSTISDKVSELEKALGVTLLSRTTRSLKLTEIGAEYFNRTKEALAVLNAAHETASKAQKQPSGTLRITASPSPPSVRAMIKAVRDYRKDYPQVKIELDFTDRVVDMMAEGFDIAVRVGSLPDSNFMVKKLGVSVLILVATPQYLKNKPSIDHPKDLVSHHCLGILNSAVAANWSLRSTQGKTARVPVKGVVSTNALIAIRDLVSLHEGIALLPHSLCRDELLRKEFVRVLPAWATPAEPVYLLYPPQKFETPKVKKFLPLLEAHLRALHVV